MRREAAEATKANGAASAGAGNRASSDAVNGHVVVGRVWHARSRPVEHAFAYPAFFLRLPLRRLAHKRWPFHWLRRNAPGALALNDADHGDGTPMVGWIDRLLARAEIHDADGELWLHTMPRVFGFLFNPVSFWFAERADGRLRAIVCEVNNTFGERHCYLLAHADARPIEWGEELAAVKALHVSPFNAVQGAYRFRFHFDEQGAARPPRFVSSIDYYDGADAHAPLLRTSVGGSLRAADDASLRRVALTWPLHTIGVVLRIHWQALRLWLRRVPLQAKPEPPARDVSDARAAHAIAPEESAR